MPQPFLIRFSRPNLRTGSEGYTWGKPAATSRILRALPAASAARLEFDPEEPVAEWWLGADDPRYPSLVAAGGGEEPLAAFLAREGERVLGAAHLARHGPRLAVAAKILDTHADAARGMLSAQVHAAPGPGRPGKPEVWIGLSPGARVRLGFAAELGEEAFRRACADASIAGLLAERKLGDGGLALVAGGMPHAVMNDSTIFEVSLAPSAADPADLRSRSVAFFDRWGGRPARPGKEEVDAAAALIAAAGLFRRARDEDWSLAERPLPGGGRAAGRRLRLAETPWFAVERLEAREKGLPAGEPGRAFLLFARRGRAEVLPPGGEPEVLEPGEHALVPAGPVCPVVRGLGGPAHLFLWRAG